LRKLVSIILLLLIVLPFFCFAELSYDPDDEVMLVDVPVYIGEEAFIKKAQERAAAAGRSQPLGLVLSGGAARAMAHLGVLKKLEEEGIVPDFMITNSMGAIIGLLYSAGISCDDIYNVMTEFTLGEFFKPQLPVKGGVLDTSRFISVIHGILGDRRIEELDIPVAVICEDLITRRQIIFEAGDMYDIIEGSIVIPVDFAPKEYMGYLLMDGGCTNLVPVDHAYRYTDKVAVSSTLYTFKQNLRNFVTVVNRMQDVSKTRKGVEEIKKHENLVWLRNPVEKYSFMGFDKSEEIIQLGYECATEHMDELKNLAELSDKTAAAQASFLSNREENREKIDDFCRRYRKTEMIPLRDLTPLFTVGISMMGEIPNDYYLNNYNYIYLGEELGYKTMRINLREYWFPDNYGLDSALTFALSDFFKSKTRGLVDFKDNKLNKFYYYSNNEIIYFSGDKVGIDPFCTLEGTMDEDFKEIDSFHRAGLKGYIGRDKFIKFSAFGFKENKDTDGWGASVNFDHRLVWLLHLQEKATYRMPLPGNDTVCLYKNDGVRGKTIHGNFDRVLMAQTTFYLKPDFTPSLAEAFIFNDVRLGVFGDFYYFDDVIFTAGLSLNFDISFIGVMPVKFLCYGGWDFDQKKIFTKFAIGTEF